MTDSLPIRARADEITDEMRTRALLAALVRAESNLDLPFGQDMTPSARAQRILLHALAGRLDPHLYGIAWFVRQEMHTRH